MPPRQSSQYSSEYSPQSSSQNKEPEDRRIQVSNDERNQARVDIYKSMFKNRNAKLGILPSMLSGAAPIFCFLIFGNLLQYLTDYTTGKLDKPMPKILKCIYLVIGLTLVASICRFLSSFFFLRVGADISVEIRYKLFNHFMHDDVTFFDTNQIGSLLTVLGEDCAVIQECFGSLKFQQFQNLGQYSIGVILLFVFSWRIGLVFLCLAPVIVFIMVSFHPHIVRNAIIRFKHISSSMTIAEETISTIRTVRGFNKEEYEINRFHNQSILSSKRDKKIGNLLTAMFSIAMTLLWGVIISLLYFGATLVGHKENRSIFTPGKLFSCFGFTFFSGFAFVMLENSLQAEQRSITACARVSKILQHVPDVPFEGGETIPDEQFKGHIVFDHVTFRYPTREAYVLRNVSWECKPGEMVALVGHSGSGKSTSVQLLERFYDITEGVITIDGHDIKTLDPRWLHRKVALVSQEPTLFQMSIRDNVLYGVSPDLSDDQVWSALEIANAKKFVTKMDKQLDQLVGERGNCLSGGQRQRIAIARAVIKNPVIMIADEATSALDAESEKKVQNALDRVLEGRTSVIVAHRLSTIRNAKVIYVFDAGEIIEVGNHESLVAKEGAYYNLVQRQLQKENELSHGPVGEEGHASNSDDESSNSSVKQNDVENVDIKEEKDDGSDDESSSSSVKQNDVENVDIKEEKDDGSDDNSQSQKEEIEHKQDDQEQSDISSELSESSSSDNK